MNVPNHEMKAFRDMTPEERNLIIDALITGDIEVNEGDGWRGGVSVIYALYPYRTRPRKLVIPWDVIKPEYKWAAMDESGIVWMHKEEPGMCTDGWYSTGNYASAILNIDTTGIDWRESLTQRPE